MNNTLVKKLSLPLITFLIAWIGGLSTIYSDWTWYESLNKPFFNPPNYLFGIVWPILYVLMAVVSFLHAQNIFKLYLMQIMLNGVMELVIFCFSKYCICFFGHRAFGIFEYIDIEKT